MSFALDPTERLARVLKENKKKFAVSKDGYVSIDLNNKEVISEIKQRFEKFEEMEHSFVQGGK
ncbi:multidrug ABC transporter ATPase [Photorhabdus sp. RM323S]|uniref:multidrug ABC transporter ATPase n=1 Tax=Photorhabdus sp. RM323S TaxID=3342828 RepID=UPI0036DECCA6